MGDYQIYRMVLMLACIHSIQSQYYDLLQAFQPFLQPQPSQPLNFLNDYTTRRPRPKQRVTVPDTKHDENIRRLDKISITDNIRDTSRRIPLEQTDKNRQTTRRKPTNPFFDFNLFTTTQRSIRKTTITPLRQKQDSKNKDVSAIVYLDEDTKSRRNNSKPKNSDSREAFDNNRPKPVTRPNNRKTQNQSLVAVNYDSSSTWYNGGRNTINYYTTRPPYHETTKTYNYLQNTNKNKNNYYTTHNPLLNRPGVKPAVVQGPPITNRPITQRPDFGHRPQQIHFDDDLNVTPEIVSGPDEDYMSAVDRKRYIDVAERMCDKYKSLNVKQVQAIPLLPSPHPVKVNVSSCPPKTIPLVVGGKIVSIQEFPHMALLGWRRTKNRGISWKCGGSLLSNQFILTAAHCAYQDKDDNVLAGPPRIVQLGSSYLNDPKAVFMKVSSVTRHPKYKLPKAYYDLALVKMSSAVTFSETIKPACLGTPPSPNNPIIATGWGRTEFGGSQSHELRSVSLPVWDITECHKALGISMKLPYGPSSDSQICAGERTGGKDTCQGDSGGPAQVQDGCLWRVVAVTSVGRFCGAAETPAIYATVQRAFISAVVFSKEATLNNNIDNTYQTTNNNQRNTNDWNNKKTEQSTSGSVNTQNSYSTQNTGINEWNNPNSGFNTELGTVSNGSNRRRNWNNDRVQNNYNQQYQPNRNEHSNNNYNLQTTDGYNKWNSGREVNESYNPGATENTGREYYNNYARNSNNRDSYSNSRDSYVRQDYVSDGRSETYYNDGNVWWT